MLEKKAEWLFNLIDCLLIAETDLRPTAADPDSSGVQMTWRAAERRLIRTGQGRIHRLLRYLLPTYVVRLQLCRLSSMSFVSEKVK